MSDVKHFEFTNDNISEELVRGLYSMVHVMRYAAWLSDQPFCAIATEQQKLYAIAQLFLEKVPEDSLSAALFLTLMRPMDSLDKEDDPVRKVLRLISGGKQD